MFFSNVDTGNDMLRVHYTHECGEYYALRALRLVVGHGTIQGLSIWARFPRSRLTSKSFVKFSMCSYERAGWLGSRDLGFSNLDLGERAENFSI